MSRKLKALEARRLNQISAQSLSDDQAIKVPGMYPNWSGKSVPYGDAEKGEPVIVLHNGSLYRCINPHTSQESWDPESASSLWTPCADPSEEWPEWIQPSGAHNSYPIESKVSHNGKHWISTESNNVWEPGVYGWEEQK